MTTLPDWVRFGSCRTLWGCLLWTGHVHKGYARYRGAQASRRAYQEVVGPIPQGMQLDHLCRQPLCVNPAHLEPVTRDENMRRRYALQTACSRGHEFTVENTYTGAGRRCCRKCQAAAVRRYKARSRNGGSA